MTASNTYGRQVVVPLTNKSGGGVVAGDVVIIDTANNDAFTTTTTGGYTSMIGVAQDTIANNAAGRVLISGHAQLVNVNASVTRGHFGTTHTVAKQATDAGASRIVGTFCQFTTGGTTPEAVLFGFPDASSATDNVATDAIWDAAGDLVQGTGANTAAKLTLGASGTVPTSTGSTNAYAYPPGYQLDRVEFTSPVSVTHTTEATADIVVTSNSTTFDGTSEYCFEFYCPDVVPDTGASGRFVLILLFDNTASTSASIGRLANVKPPAAAADDKPVFARRFLTPSAGARVYSVRAITSAGTASVAAGAGGTGAYVPGYLRITKA